MVSKLSRQGYVLVFFTAAFLTLFFLGTVKKVSAGITTDCSNVAGLWNFNGNAADSSGKNSSGTLQNGATCDFQGKFGSACKFDGVDDYLNLGSGSSLDNLNKFTLSLWVKKLGGESYKMLVSKNASSRWHWSLYSTSSQFTSYLSHAGTGSQAANSSSSVGDFPYYEWIHLAATYDASGDRYVHLYANGEETGYYTKQISIGSLLSNAAEDLIVGGVAGQDSFEGVIDDLAIYNRALSPAEINEIHDSNSQLNCGACVPKCDGKTCGDNGCGGSCGTCSGGNVCNAGGTACVAKTECTDGIDNDGDKKIDYADVGCFESDGSQELMPGELVVKNVQRLTPKEYTAPNNFWSHRPTFNYDDTRMMIYEDANVNSIHPLYGKQGRNLCWGEVEKLKNWKTVQEYEQACRPIPGYSSISQPFSSVYWSIYPDEKYIVYAPFKDGWLKRLDTENPGLGWIDYINLVPAGAAANQLNTRCFGWDNKEQLICNLDNENWYTKFGNSQIVGWAINIGDKIMKPVENWFSGDGEMFDCRPQGASYSTPRYNGFSITSHGHGDIRGDYQVAVGGYKLFRLPDCHVVADPNRRDPYTSHLDWDVSPDWFITDGYANFSGNAPAVRTNAITQIFINIDTETFGKRLDLHYQPTAQGWIKKYDTQCIADSDCGYNKYCNVKSGFCERDVSNYHAGLLPKLNNSGTALVYTSTGGKYSLSDYLEYGIDHGWTGEEVGTLGLYLMEFEPSNNIFAPADVNGDDHVNIKDIQACIKVITRADLTYENQCKVLADPDITTNIKDIQVIIQAIIGG